MSKHKKRRPTGIPEDVVREAHHWQRRHRCPIRVVAAKFGLNYADLKFDLKRLKLRSARVLYSESVWALRDSIEVPKGPEIPDDKIREIHQWYTTTPKATIREAAKRFGIRYEQVRARFEALDLPSKPVIADQVDLDFVAPFRAQISEWDRQRATRMRNG